MASTVRRIDCAGPGIRRLGAGRGFYYRDEDGKRVTDPEVLERIRLLAIPPAWREVWICSDPWGHIQATGIDAKGRRQYRYHQGWQLERSRDKYDRVLRMAEHLPALRAQVERDLAQPGMPRRRVLACAVRLLERGLFRVGGEEYAEENGSFGLATLRREHVRVSGDRVTFDYPAKSGQHRHCVVHDPDVAAVVRALRRRRAAPDAELLAYRGADGTWVDVRSADVNRYLQDTLGAPITAKDFRTWAATVLAALALAEEDPPATDADLRRTVAGVAAEVAEQLGNTPAVVRSSYIDPRVVEAFDAGEELEVPDDPTDPDAVEAEVIRLITRVAQG